MEMGRQRLQDDRMSGNWSFGSKNNPCSQSRKMSIGVMVNSSANTKSKNGKESLADLQTSQNMTSAKTMPPDFGKENKGPNQESSQPVRTKTSHQNISYSGAINHQKLPSMNNVVQKPSGSKTVNEVEPDSYFANQLSYLHAMNANEKKLQNNTYQKEKDSSYVTPQKVHLPENEKTEQGTSGNVTLRMKVHELLGTICTPDKKQQSPENYGIKANNQKPKTTTNNNDSSPVSMLRQHLHTRKVNSNFENSGMDANNEKPKTTTNNNHSPVSMLRQHLHTRKVNSNSENSGMNANNEKPKNTINKNDSSPVSMLRQHLHTRKANSGSSGQKVKRPVTRSLANKKPQAQKSVPKKQSPFDRVKQAHLDENAFTFLETWSKGPQNTNVDRDSKTFKRKEREVYGTRPVKTRVVETVDKNEENTKTKTKSAAANVPLFQNRKRESETVNPDTEMKEQTHRQFEVNNMGQDSFTKHSLKKNVGPQYDLKSPTFEMKTTAEISSPESLFPNNQEDKDKDIDVDSLSEESFKTKQTRSSHSKSFSKGSHYNANTKNLGMDLEDTPVIKSDILGTHKENIYFRSSSKVVESESSEDDSPITVPTISKKCEENKWSVSPCQEEDSESSEDDSPIKENGDCDKLHDSPEQDGLAGAVKLFALALERIQSKIHSTTSKQSAAILLSVSNNIHSQLQNAESKIQNEVGKLTNIGKSKRMLPENQCQEQQEQLMRIYEKFKEEVDQHLEKCRNTLEGLEEHQLQVRGMVEKQRLSHKKFILQTEEAIEKQLNDAQTKLAEVHRMGKEKTLQLKYGIAECLKEGLLG